MSAKGETFVHPRQTDFDESVAELRSRRKLTETRSVSVSGPPWEFRNRARSACDTLAVNHSLILLNLADLERAGNLDIRARIRANAQLAAQRQLDDIIGRLSDKECLYHLRIDLYRENYWRLTHNAFSHTTSL